MHSPSRLGLPMPHKSLGIIYESGQFQLTQAKPSAASLGRRRGGYPTSRNDDERNYSYEIKGENGPWSLSHIIPKSFAGLRPADSPHREHGVSESGSVKPSGRFCALAGFAGERGLCPSQRGRESRSIGVWTWPPAASGLPEGAGGA